MKIEITLNEETLRAISYLKEPSSKEALTPEQAIQALADDLGMTNTRPGSWEGSNMQTVIDGHGWESHLGSE
ncbi:MAG: hypothetical protein QM500_19515 [Methylococcales bacterium]